MLGLGPVQEELDPGILGAAIHHPLPVQATVSEILDQSLSAWGLILNDVFCKIKPVA